MPKMDEMSIRQALEISADFWKKKYQQVVTGVSDMAMGDTPPDPRKLALDAEIAKRKASGGVYTPKPELPPGKDYGYWDPEGTAQALDPNARQQAIADALRDSGA
jgi:hypothetical protein